MAKVQTIQMDSKVTMKMASYCQEGIVAEDYSYGTLLGMIDGDKMEITNCFPYPKKDDEDLQQYELDMQRCCRNVNGDYLNVGWFTPSVYGKFLDRNFIENQAHYQSKDPDAVALVYDPQKTVKGCLSMKAYRLSDKLLELIMDKRLTLNCDVMKECQLKFSTMVVEIPIEVKMSPLANILVQKLVAMNPVPKKVEYLDLSHGSSLEHQLRGMMQSVDDLAQENGKFVQHQRSVFKYNQAKATLIARHNNENAERERRGEKPLPDVDLSKIQRPTQNPDRLTAMLAAKQLDQLTDQITQFSSQSLGRVLMTEAMENTGL